MVSSMTGFGRCEKDLETGRLRVEIRGVNHRYLDLNLRINHRLNIFEQKIRNIIKSTIKRGKLDVTVMLDVNSDADVELVYNEKLAAKYLEKLAEIAEDFNLHDDITTSKLAHFNDVLVEQEGSLDAESLWDDLQDALKTALNSFCESRLTEGESLKKDILLKLDEVSSCVVTIEERSPMIIEEYKKKLTEKVSDLLGNNQIDESRIAMEVVLLADKICVDEELVRLKSHISSAKDTIQNSDEVGRKMDFIAQEMNREANTILSKTNDAEISNIGITLKTSIEKIREQIQNLE